MPASSTTTVVPVFVVRLTAAPLVDELGDGVGRHARLVAQHLGRLGRRRETERWSSVLVQILDGTSERCRLAGAGGADDEHELVLAGDRCSGVGLQDVEPLTVERDRWRCRRVVRFEGEGQDALLLGENALVGEERFGRGDPDRPAVGRAHRPGRPRWVERHTSVDDPVAGVLDGRRPVASRHLRHRRGEVADRLQHVCARPGRAVGRERLENVGHAERRQHGICLANCRVDRREQPLRCPAHVGGFAEPARREVRGQGVRLGRS
jgi:hypothetical protein